MSLNIMVYIGNSVFMNADFFLLDKVEILWTSTVGGGVVKANVDPCGQEVRGSPILLKLCGRHKWMSPNVLIKPFIITECL